MQNKLLFFILLLPFLSCENDLSEVEKYISKDEITYEVSKGVELLYSDSARIRVEIRGETLKRYLDKSNPRQEYPDGVIATFYGENLEVTGRLTAKYAVRYDKKSQIILRDSVVWTSAAQERLETSELIWDEKKSKIFSDKFVTIERPGEIIYGYGFEADQDFKRSKIRAVTGRTKIDIRKNIDP